MSTDQPPVIAVTGMNARADNPGPGLAVARCLRDAGRAYRIVGLGYDALDPGLYSSRCDAGYLLPYPSAGPDALRERLLAIHAEESLDAIVPCLDAELPVFAALADELRERGIRMLLPTLEQLMARDKSRLAELARRVGVRYPETRSVTDAGFFYRAPAEGWAYPFVVKGPFYDAQIVRTAEEGTTAFRRIAAVWGLPLLVQRLVSGEEFNLAGLGNGQGGLAGAVMMKKKALTEKGKAWAGITIHDDRLLEVGRAICGALCWRGPLEVEAVRDSDGGYHLIEINPRFPAWIYLSSGAGCNLPQALAGLVLGETLEPLPPPRVGVLFVRSAEEIIVPLEAFEAVAVGGATPGNR